MADIQSLIWCVLKHTSRQHGWFFLCQEFSVASFLYLPHRRLQSSPVSSYWDFLALQLYLFTLHFHRTAYWLWSARFPLSCSDPGLSEHVRLGDGGMPECLSPTASLSEGFDGMFLSLALFALAFFYHLHLHLSWQASDNAPLQPFPPPFSCTSTSSL